MSQLLFFIIVIGFILWIMKGYRRYEKVHYNQEQFRHFTLTREHLARSELGLFVALTAKVAKADGKVEKLEAELIGNMFDDISKVFPDPEHARTLLKEIFNLEKQIVYNVDDTALALQRLIARDPHKRHMMMSFLVNLAFVDGHLSHAEEAMLYKIGAFLHLRQSELEAMFQQASHVFTHATSSGSIDKAYALLDASESDSLDVIKKKYRALVRKHHPDIIKAQGLGDDYIKQATEKVQEINAAYELIKKHKGA
jgi:DnaJ like chaperone protein